MDSTRLKWTQQDSNGLIWTQQDSTGLIWTQLDSTRLKWTQWTQMDSTGLNWDITESNPSQLFKSCFNSITYILVEGHFAVILTLKVFGHKKLILKLE